MILAFSVMQLIVKSSLLLLQCYKRCLLIESMIQSLERESVSYFPLVLGRRPASTPTTTGSKSNAIPQSGGNADTQITPVAHSTYSPSNGPPAVVSSFSVVVHVIKFKFDNR